MTVDSAETSIGEVPRNVVQRERDVIIKQTRVHNRGGSSLALKWTVENMRTGAAQSFDNLGQAELFFEKQAARNARPRRIICAPSHGRVKRTPSVH